MNKVKQMLGIILSVVIVLSCVPVAAYADSVVEIYNGDTQVTDLIYLQEYRSAELSAKISSEVSGETTVEWVSNLPLLADVDENGKVTAYDYSKRAVIQLWIDENIASLPIVGPSLADQIWKTIDDSNIDLDNTNNDAIVAIVASVVGDELAASLKTALDNMNVKITATVYDAEGNKLGSDTVEVVVEKSVVASVAPTAVHITNKKVVPKTVAVGATVQLYGVCTPVRLKQGVKWSVGKNAFDSESSKCADVSSDGLVTFKAAGTCTVKVNPESTLYAAFSDTVTFTVLEQSAYPVKDFSITGSSSVAEGKTTQLTIENVTPAGAYYGDLTWSSSDPSVAIVDSNGIVTGLDGGSGVTFYKEVTITAKIGSVIKEFPMRVTRSVLNTLSSVEISGSESIGIGNSQQLTATVFPERLNNNSGVTRDWGIYDSATDSIVFATDTEPASNSFITVDKNGLLTGVAPGVSTVWVRAAYGSSEVTDSITITSGKAITDFEITGTLSVKEGEQTKLSIKVNAPSDYETTLLDTVKWSVENADIATVSEDGTVHGRDAGGRTAFNNQKTVVSATVCGITKTAEVKVTSAGLIDKYTDAYIVGDDSVVVDFPRQYSYKTYPSRLTNQMNAWGMADDNGNAPWESLNALVKPSEQNTENSLASISEGGVVTAKAAGSAELYLYLSTRVQYTEVRKTVNLVEVAPTNITITPPSKKEYIEGNTELDLSGMEVYLTYSKDALKPYYSDADSFTEDMLKVKVEDYTVKEINTDILDAEQYIMVSATRAGETLNAVFPITVYSKAVESIDIKAPDKYEYLEGEKELDLTGLEVTANYSNAESEAVTDYTIDYSTFDPELYDVIQNVKVVYTHAGRSAEGTFPVIVYGKPVISVAVDGTVGDWTAGDVKFTLTSTHELDGAKYMYKTGGDENAWTELPSNELTVSENIAETYRFKAVNSHKLESDESEIYSVKIDKVEPSFELVPALTEITSSSFDVAIDSASYGASGIKELALNGESIKGSTSFTVTENGTYTVVLTTGSGLSATRTVEITNIDTEAPEITSVSLSQLPSDAASRVIDSEKFGKFFSGNIAATVNAVDHGVAGIEKIEYRLSSEGGEAGEWALYEGSEAVLCSSEFKGVIEFRATDKAGNVSEICASDGFVRDGKAPEISNVKAESGAKDYENGSWVADAVRFTPEATAFSGIYEYYIKMDNGEWQKFTDEYVEVTEDGSHEYFFKAVSYSGLESEPYKFRVNIDRVMPLIRVDFEGTFGRWTSENVKFTLSTLNECPSGVTYYYDCGAGWQKIEGNVITFTENSSAYYKFKAVNGAGTESAESDSYNVMIDTVTPTATYVFGETDKTATPYDIVFVPVCGDSGVRKVYFDGEDVTDTLKATVRKNGRYILTVIGNNLLSSTQVITVKNFSNLPSEQFTYTYLDEKSANIISYNGKSDVVTVPYDINDHAVTELQAGAFRENKYVKEVAIQNGFETIGEACFVNCENLEKITIPDTVTEIGAYAFNGCHENLTIYCYKGSRAQSYAEENGINYVLLDLKPLGRTEVDTENLVIYSDMEGCTKVSDFLSAEGYYMVGVPSQVSGTTEYYGTGSLVYLFKDGKVKYIYTFVLRGDLNGDGYVDVVDALIAQKAANEQADLYDDFVFAADFDYSGGVETIDYQCVVNTALYT